MINNDFITLPILFACNDTVFYLFSLEIKDNLALKDRKCNALSFEGQPLEEGRPTLLSNQVLSKSGQSINENIFTLTA
jgi:hypothetical protein